jgi:hypothetical protein
MLFLAVLVRRMSRRRMPPLTQRDATLICYQQSTLAVVKLDWRDHCPLRQSEALIGETRSFDRINSLQGNSID